MAQETDLPPGSPGGRPSCEERPMPDPTNVPGRHVMLSVLMPLLLVTIASPVLMIKKPPPSISLEIVGAKGGVVNREAASGWPLTLRLSSNGELGIGRPIGSPVFPRFGEVGYLVFSDPDGCFSFGLENGCPTTDETYLEFTPDVDLPGRTNQHGNPDRLIALSETGGGGSPRVLTFNFDTHLNDRLTPYGPEVGGGDTLENHCSGVLDYEGQACTSNADCLFFETCRQIVVNADGYGYG